MPRRSCFPRRPRCRLPLKPNTLIRNEGGPNMPGRFHFSERFFSMDVAVGTSFSMSLLGWVGASALARLAGFRYVAAVACTGVGYSLLLHRWTRAMRSVLSRQILFTAIEAVPLLSLIACGMGFVVVMEAQLWLNRIGQTVLLGPLLVAVLIRELAPLLANFVVIGRSGTAITTELANMKVSGEVKSLDAQGLDPFTYLLLPRVAGVAFSVLCLTVLFVVVAMISGFYGSSVWGDGTSDPRIFMEQVLGAMKPVDILNVLAKTILPGWLTGTICCVEGLSVGAQMTDVPQAASRGVIRSVVSLFLISVVVSVLTYL